MIKINISDYSQYTPSSRFTFWWDIRNKQFWLEQKFYFIPGKTLFAEANVWVSREAEPANKFRFILPALPSSLLFVLSELSRVSFFLLCWSNKMICSALIYLIFLSLRRRTKRDFFCCTFFVWQEKNLNLFIYGIESIE